MSGSWQQYHNLSNWSLDNLSLWDKTELCVSVLGVIYGSVMNTVATILGQLMEFIEIIYSPWSAITMVTILKGVRTCCWGLQSPFSALERSQVFLSWSWRIIFHDVDAENNYLYNEVAGFPRCQKTFKRLSKDLRTCVKTFYLCPKDQKSPAQHFVGRYLHGY